LAWRKSHALLGKIKHPLIFISPDMAASLDLLHPSEGVALRATVIADPQGIVRFASANDSSVGRNVDEILRVLDGLQTGELTGCNWKPGEATLG
jgi:peroxiredoxin (alkyl hydroperoxide reductase subunit C)